MSPVHLLFSGYLQRITRQIATQHWQVESNSPSVTGQALRSRKELLKLFKGRRDSPSEPRTARSPRTRQLLPHSPANSTRHPGLPQNWDSEIHCTHSALCRQPQTSYPLLDPLDRKLTDSKTTRAHSGLPSAKPRNRFLLPPEVTDLTRTSFQPSHNGGGTGGSATPPSWRGRYGNPFASASEFTNSKCGRGRKRFPSPCSNSLLCSSRLSFLSPLPRRVPQHPPPSFLRLPPKRPLHNLPAAAPVLSRLTTAVLWRGGWGVRNTVGYRQD